MDIPEYQYDVEHCDVPSDRRVALSEYRTFRRQCLDYMRGPADTSVMNQVHDLAWHTAVFRTLNEARRLEPARRLNGAFWELTSAGYASLMTLGIRKLVDKDRRANSLWNVVSMVERRQHLLTRETFVCYDGLPYDFETVFQAYINTIDPQGAPSAQWLSTRGPTAWATSKMLHEAFDKLSCTTADTRTRQDQVHPSVLEMVKEGLRHSSITSVCDLANKRIAHADRLSEHSEPIPIATHKDIDTALQHIVRMTNFLSTSFFYDTAFGSVVPTPQFDVLEALDQPWITTDNLPALHEYWKDLCRSIDSWTSAEAIVTTPVAQ